MLIEDEFRLVVPSTRDAPPVKLLLTGPVWLYPICRPKVTSQGGELLLDGMPKEGNTVVISVGIAEMGVKWKKPSEGKK